MEKGKSSDGIEKGAPVEDIKIQFDKKQAHYQRFYLNANNLYRKDMVKKFMYEAESLFIKYIAKDKLG